MNGHLHVGTVDAIVVACYLVVFGFLWRTAAAKWSEHPVGQAMAYIY